MENSINNPYVIDVVIPVYNGQKFILKAVKSVINQTFQVNQIIIVDDGSTDNTREIIYNYIKESKIKIEIIAQENKGLSGARNTGILNSTAPFIAFLDADDEWVNNKLEEQILIFRRNTFNNLGIVYCAYELIDEDSVKINQGTLKIDTNVRGMIFEKILGANKIISSASGALIKRDCFQKVGYFDESLKACEDWDMWLRISRCYEFDYSDKILVRIRQHSQNMQKNKEFMMVNHINFFNKWAKILNKNQVPKKWKNDIFSSVYLDYSDSNKLLNVTRNNMSKRCYDALFGNSPSIKLSYILFVINKKISSLVGLVNNLK